MAWNGTKVFTPGEALLAADLNDYVSENLDYLLVPNKVEVRQSTGTFTTTSTSLVAINAAYTVNIDLHGGHLLVGMSGNFTKSAGEIEVVIDVNGTPYSCGYSVATTVVDPGYTMNFSTLIGGLAAGTYTITLKWKVASGTATTTKTVVPLVLWAMEV